MVCEMATFYPGGDELNRLSSLHWGLGSVNCPRTYINLFGHTSGLVTDTHITAVTPCTNMV